MTKAQALKQTRIHKVLKEKALKLEEIEEVEAATIEKTKVL